MQLTIASEKAKQLIERVLGVYAKKPFVKNWGRAGGAAECGGRAAESGATSRINYCPSPTPPALNEVSPVRRGITR